MLRRPVPSRPRAARGSSAPTTRTATPARRDHGPKARNSPRRVPCLPDEMAQEADPGSQPGAASHNGATEPGKLKVTIWGETRRKPRREMPWSSARKTEAAESEPGAVRPLGLEHLRPDVGRAGYANECILPSRPMPTMAASAHVHADGSSHWPGGMTGLAAGAGCAVTGADRAFTQSSRNTSSVVLALVRPLDPDHRVRA